MIVPVLSEAITVADPKVSMHSNYLTYTYLAPSLLAITVKIVVTVVGNPSGTLAQITIMNPLMKTYNGFYPLATPIIKKITPITAAIFVINFTTCSISTLRLDVSVVVPVTFAAMLPIKVLLPVLITNPTAYPS